jgi:hypothetical protein
MTMQLFETYNRHLKKLPGMRYRLVSPPQLRIGTELIRLAKGRYLFLDPSKTKCS